MSKSVLSFAFFMHLICIPSLFAGSDEENAKKDEEIKKEDEVSETNALLDTSTSVSFESLSRLFENIFSLHSTEDGYLDIRFLGALGRGANPTRTVDFREAPPEALSPGERRASNCCPGYSEIVYRLFYCCCDIPYFCGLLRQGSASYLNEAALQEHARHILSNVDADEIAQRQLVQNMRAVQLELDRTISDTINSDFFRTILNRDVWTLIFAYMTGYHFNVRINEKR